MNNPYEAKEEILEERKVQSSPLYVSMWIAVFVLLLLTLAVTLTVSISMTAWPIYNHATKPKPKFQYGEKVMVIDGFNTGRSGVVVDEFRSFDGTWDLMIDFGRDYKHVPEEYLVR
jgi:hypothetical protein